MTGPSATCQYKGCRRTVRHDYGFYPFCYDHRQSSANWQEALLSVHEVDMGSTARPSLASMTNAQLASNLYKAGTPVASDIADRIPVAMEKFAAGNDLTIPAVARERLAFAATEFRAALASCGVNPRRMQALLKVEGMNRLILIPDRPAIVQKGVSISHTALLVDYGTGNQVVVDPAIAFFAPVRRTELPVESELVSGETQFGDSPWVGAVSDYTESATLWWDRSWVVEA